MHSYNDPDLQRSLPQRRGRRMGLLIAVLLPIMALTGFFIYHLHSIDLSLSQAYAEADALDPGWQLQDVLRRREAIADEENAAMQMLKAKRLLPAKFPLWYTEADWKEKEPALGEGTEFDKQLDELPRPARLNEDQLRVLRHELNRAKLALVEARKLAAMRRGSHSINYSADWLSTMLPSIQETRTVAQLLSYDAMVLCHEGRIDEALRSCRAMIIDSAAIGDEPLFIAQLVRIAVRAIAVRQIERVLAQGEASDAEMANLQQLLLEEAEQPLLLFAFRGERAGMDQCIQAIDDGVINTKLAFGLSSGGPRGSGEEIEELMLHMPGALKMNRAALLRYYNQMVELAKQAGPEERQKFLELDKSAKEGPLLLRMLAPSGKIAEAGYRTKAELRCAATGLAVERYRKMHGRWPEKLTELIPQFMQTVLTDPYDGAPLRYRRDPDGVVVYTVGTDGKDDGGSFATLNTQKPGTDVGFRLWDLSRRGQAAQKKSN